MSITGFLPYLSAICPVGTFNINIAKAGALMTNPFALCDKPIDCAYNGNAGNKTPTPMYKTNCESNKPASGVKTVSRGMPYTVEISFAAVPDDDDDDDDDVLEADRRLRASMPQRRASTSPRRLFSFARLRRLFAGADDNGIKRTMSAPGGRNLVDF